MSHGVRHIFGNPETTETPLLNSPLVVPARQQDTRMRLANPVLGHDLVAMAAPVTKWSVQVGRADKLARGT